MNNKISYVSGSSTVLLTDSDFFGGVEFQQEINTEDDLHYGVVSIPSIRFYTTLSAAASIKDKTVTWQCQTATDSAYRNKGYYVVKTVTKQKTKAEVIAYHKGVLLDKNVDSWLDGLTFPTTLGAMATSLATYCGLTIQPLTTAQHSELSIPSRNFTGENITGRQMMEYIASAANCNCVPDNATYDLKMVRYSNHYVTAPPSAHNFATDTWEDINNIVTHGKASYYYHVGDTKSVTLTSTVLGTTTHLIQIIDIDKDGENTITCQTKNTLANAIPFSTDSTPRWAYSNVRTQCQNYYAAAPFKDYIKTVRKGTNTDYYTSSVVYTNETVFLPSFHEMGGLRASVYSPPALEFTENVNQRYAYYSDNTARKKYQGDNSTTWATYWLRSRSGRSSGNAIEVPTNGAFADYGATSGNLYVAPAFVIGVPNGGEDPTQILLNLTNSDYVSTELEDYATAAITGVRIASSSEDVGYSAGTMTNPYQIVNNPLFFSSTVRADLQALAATILTELTSISYKPMKVKLLGDHTIECGDIITVNSNTCYVMSKKLSNSGCEIECKGQENRTIVNEQVDTKLITINNTTNELRRDVDSNTSTITQVQGDLTGVTTTVSTLSQTVDEISLEVQGKLDQDEVDARVDVGLSGLSLSYDNTGVSGQNSCYIKLNSDGVQIAGSTIQMTNVTATSISADNITAGTLNADNIGVNDSFAVKRLVTPQSGDPYYEIVGYVGAAQGNDGQSTTYGAKLTSENGNNYAIVTNAGARLQVGNTSLWLENNKIRYKINGGDTTELGFAVFS